MRKTYGVPVAASAGLVLLLATQHIGVAIALVSMFGCATVVIVDRRRIGAVLWGAVAFTAPMNGVRLARSVALSDALLVLAVAVTLPELALRRPSPVPGPLVAALGLLVCAGLLASLFATSPATSLVNIAKLALAAGGSVMAVAAWNPRRPVLLRFAWLWFAGATVSATYALIAPRIAYVGRAQGLTTHPNHLGLVCQLAAGLGLGLVLSSSSRNARRVALVAVLILLAATGASGSRAAVLGEVTTILVAAVLMRRPRLIVGSAVLVSLLFVAVAAGAVHVPDNSALARLGGGGGSTASDIERRQNLSDGFALYSAHPLTGAGFGYAIEAHNIYLQALVIAGPLGLVALVWAAATIVGTGLSGVRLSGSKRDAAPIAGLVAGYMGYLVSALLEPILWDRYLWIYVGLLVVLSSARVTDPVLIGDPGREGAPAARPVRAGRRGREQVGSDVKDA